MALRKSPENYLTAFHHLCAVVEQVNGVTCNDVMHQSIPAVPIPLGNSGAFSPHCPSRGSGNTITPGHLIISQFPTYIFVASFDDQFIGKYSKFFYLIRLDRTQTVFYVGYAKDLQSGFPNCSAC